MNHWHLITSEYPPDIGGVSDYCRQMADGLARTGDEVHVWCPAGTSRPERPTGPRVRVHAELGRLRLSDLWRADRMLSAYAAPRRLLVQWVPHGFGWHSMNLPFCWWILRRARLGDRVELMVHEPYLGFSRGPLRHVAMAAIHRVMVTTLLLASDRVWVAIPAWTRLLRPYALRRRLPFTWLPVPSHVSERSSARRERWRAERLPSMCGPVVGHFGSVGAERGQHLEALVPDLAATAAAPSVLLVGAGSEDCRRRLVAATPSLADRVRAIDHVPSDELAACLLACDLMVQPYPDGISTRRTSAMAPLSLGIPIITTRGHLTEPIWGETAAVSLVDVDDVRGVVREADRLLRDPVARQRLGQRGRVLYHARFDLHHAIVALRAA